MIADATLHEIVGVLLAEADHLDVVAHLSVENRNVEYARAKVERSARLRGYAAEIKAHLAAPPATPGDDAII
jgi:hypothetical protein